MKQKILAFAILLLLFFSPLPIVNSFESETIRPIADTYVDAWDSTSPHGDRDYLEVSDYASGLAITAIMFDISEVSYIPNASSEIKLRLYCFYVPSPNMISVHWCVNNTWNEENLTFVDFRGFSRTDPEDAIEVSSDGWYEWKVTNLVSSAMKEKREKITLTLEVMAPSKGIARFASKDQPTEYSPQLVFTYFEQTANPIDAIVQVVSGLIVTAAIVFLAYRFLKRPTRKRPTRYEKQKRTGTRCSFFEEENLQP
jgi:hypothetical protein